MSDLNGMNENNDAVEVNFKLTFEQSLNSTALLSFLSDNKVKMF